MKNTNFNITKKSGEVIRFDYNKLKKSFERSGASQKDINDVIIHLSEKVYDGITTKKLFQLAYAFLRKRSQEVGGRYRLKNAIMELGPSGFPFERFVAELLKYQGFNTIIGEVVKGHCVSHEVDVIAQKDEQKIMVECKFHGNNRNRKNSAYRYFLCMIGIDAGFQLLVETHTHPVRLLQNKLLAGLSFAWLYSDI